MSIGEHELDDARNLLHFRASHAERGQRGSAEAQSAGIPGAMSIERERIAVESDPTGAQCRLRLTACQTEGLRHVEQKQMVVSSVCHNLERLVQARLSQGLRVFHDSVGVGLELWLTRLAEGNRFRCQDMREWSAEEHGAAFINPFSKLLLAEHKAATGATQGLMRGAGDHMRVGNGVVKAAPCSSADHSRIDR